MICAENRSSRVGPGSFWLYGGEGFRKSESTVLQEEYETYREMV